MTVEKLNCWQHEQCGREPGGARAHELGACSAATDATCDGINGGANAGRFCWAVAGSSAEHPECLTLEKIGGRCQECGFFRRVKYEEGPHLQLIRPGLAMTDLAGLHRLLNSSVMLIGICRDIFACLATRPLLERVVEHACRITRSSSASAYLLSAANDELRLEAHAGPTDRPERVALDADSPAAEAARTARLCRGDAAPPDRGRPAAVAAIPISGAVELAGVLELVKPAGSLSNDDEWFLREFGLIAGLGIENARHVEDLRQLKRFDKAKSRFVALLMHHITSPLATIACSLQALAQLGQKLGEDDRRELIENSLNRINSVQELSRKLLDLAAIRSGTSLANLRPVRPIEAMRQEVEARAAMAREKGVEIVVTDRGGDAAVDADPDGLRLVFGNLLNNAIKYSAGPVKRVDVVVTADRTHVCASVRDRGIGIPPEEQTRIFEEFHRGSNVAEAHAPGFGLGLAMVKELVERYHGHIDVESAPGHGTTFAVALPIAADAAAAP
jgi:signal transduction histidine kinase